LEDEKDPIKAGPWKMSEGKCHKSAARVSEDEQATVLLMKGCGLLQGKKTPDEVDKNKFHVQFVDHMAQGVESDLRVMFGM
jgi:hypothetical protein